MIYHGRVQDGKIVLTGGAHLPEGTEVRVDVADEVPLTSRSNGDASQSHKTIWDHLLALAGTADGLPPDYAAQHDHYLYGTPKR